MWLEGLDDDTYQFQGVGGVARSFSAPSVLGSIEFASKYQQFCRICAENSDKVGVDLYAIDLRFKTTVDRCLKLWHIDTDWLSWAQVERLLFGWEDDDGTYHQPILLSIQGGGDPNPGATAPTAEELIAALASTQGGVQKAIELLSNLTPSQLTKILSAGAQSAPKEQVPPTTEEEGMRRLAEHMRAVAANGN